MSYCRARGVSEQMFWSTDRMQVKLLGKYMGDRSICNVYDIEAGRA